MTWDYFAFLAENRPRQEILTGPEGLACGFVDEVSVRFLQGDKNRVRKRYVQRVKRLEDTRTRQANKETFDSSNSHNAASDSCEEKDFRPDFNKILSRNWLGLKVYFELLTPWYSKDDRIFHLLENPLRKDRLFGVPFMAASSWKGMLRWACRMHSGLHKHLEESGGKADNWQDPDWILHLFGNEKGQGEEFSRGALVFYPTRFNKLGFEVINPHSRERRAGTHPVYYEVVPPRAQGTLSLLYAPWPGMKPSAEPKKVIYKLLEAIEKLLTTYGFSAKRTVGWGTAKTTKWQAYHKERGEQSVEDQSWNTLWNNIQSWFGEQEQQ